MAEASYPDDLLYHDQHDWARLGGRRPRHLRDHLVRAGQLGEVVFYDPPEVGATVAKDSSYAEVESVKAVSDVIAPLSGEIVEVNEALADAPEQINEDPYGEGWLVKVKLSDPAEAEGAARRRGIPQAPERGVSKRAYLIFAQRAKREIRRPARSRSL